VNNDSFIWFSAPRVEWSTRKTKSLRPKVMLNVTFNGYKVALKVFSHCPTDRGKLLIML
jgi:hypothetical protein